VDHITPLADGGAPFDHENLQPLCASCHNRKSAMELAQKKRTPPRDTHASGAGFLYYKDADKQ
jgi:5-methylcytosine-specific restriction endonuclease McrA